MVPKPLYYKRLGFSLLEVLVSILVLSVGLLGLGGLQLTALKGANNAHFRTVASIAATDLAERMRINPIAIAAGLYETEYELSTCDTKPTQFCEASVICTPEEVAAYDLYRVGCGVYDDDNQTGGLLYGLPTALMSISCGVDTPCISNIEHTISINWNESDDSDEDTLVQTRSYQLDFIP